MTKRITRASTGTRVSIRKDRMGGLQVWPATLAMEKQVRELGADGVSILKFGAYIPDHEADEWARDNLTDRTRRNLSTVWQHRAYISDDLACCLFGIEF